MPQTIDAGRTSDLFGIALFQELSCNCDAVVLKWQWVGAVVAERQINCTSSWTVSSS